MIKFRSILIVFVILWSAALNAQTLFTDQSEIEGTFIQHLVPDDVTSDLPFGTGAAWFDYDNDGDLDLYVTQRSGANQLFRNNRIGTGEESFTSVNAGDAADGSHDGAGVAVADYDNDGDLDLYLANSNKDVLLSNDGEGNFTDVTSEAFPGMFNFLPGRGTSASWGDLNNDGWLDLYVANQVALYGDPGISSQDYLFISNGGYPVTFYDASNLLSGDNDGDGDQDLEGFSFIAALTDFDLDGDLDIYTTNDCPFGPEDNKLWRNDGDLSFTEISTTVGPFDYGSIETGEATPSPDCHNAMGIAVGDPNRDGYFDYFYTNWNDNSEAAVFLHNDNGNLINETRSTGLQDLVVPSHGLERISWGAVFLDFDLDGFQDLAVATGILNGDNEEDNPAFLQPNLLYHHDGLVNDLPQYSRVADIVSGTADTGKGRTLVMGDYDMDGDPDLFLVNFGGKTRMYRNENSNANNWLVIDLVGCGAPFSNKNGIGSKITITTPDGVSQHHEVRSGSNLGGGDDIGAYFGLSTSTFCNITIKWPSGLVQNIENQATNQRIKISEPAITLVSPSASDSFESGALVNISWTSAFDDPIAIQLMRADTLVTTLASGIENLGNWEWTVDNDLEASDEYAIRILSEVNSNIYKSTDGYFTITDGNNTITGIDDHLVNSLISIANNYPNPFHNRTAIPIVLEKNLEINLKVLDIRGQEIIALSSEKKYQAGKHEIIINMENYPPGLYFFCLSYEGGQYNGKMIMKKE